jgi:hypothetical protein
MQRWLIERNVENSRWAGAIGLGTEGQGHSSENPCDVTWRTDSIIRSVSRLTSWSVKQSAERVSRRPEITAVRAWSADQTVGQQSFQLFRAEDSRHIDHRQRFPRLMPAVSRQSPDKKRIERV